MARFVFGVIFWLVIVVGVFWLAGSIASALGYPEKTHLFVILLIAAVMIFSAAIVNGLNRGQNPFK